MGAGPAAAAVAGRSAASTTTRAASSGASAARTRSRPRRLSASERAESARGFTGEASPAEERAYYREVGRRDAARSEAFDRGRRKGTAQARARRGRRLDAQAVGGGGDAELDELEREGAASGFGDTRRSQRRDDLRRVASRATDVANTNPRAGIRNMQRALTGNASGFVLGLLAYAVLFAYLENGPAGVRAWLAAKFLNRVPGEQWARPASSTTTSSAGGTQTAAYVAGGTVAGEWAFPVRGPGVTFSDSFGAARSGGRRHQGIDIMAPRGAQVVAVQPGTVVGDFTDDLGGNVVRVLGDDGNRYYYAHLQPGSIRVEPGQRVGAGQLLAGVGNSGNAAGGPTHLHFSVNEGRPGVFDPYRFLRAAWDRLNGTPSTAASSAVAWA